MSTDESKRKGYEIADAPALPVAVGIGVLIALMFAGFVGGKIFEAIFEATEVRSRPAPEPMMVKEEVKGPLLQAHPEVELADYRREQHKILYSSDYEWVDKENKKVRIPIEDAIVLVAQKGLPVWEPVVAKIPGAEVPPEESPDEASAEDVLSSTTEASDGLPVVPSSAPAAELGSYGVTTPASLSVSSPASAPASAPTHVAISQPAEHAASLPASAPSSLPASAPASLPVSSPSSLPSEPKASESSEADSKDEHALATPSSGSPDGESVPVHSGTEP